MPSDFIKITSWAKIPKYTPLTPRKVLASDWETILKLKCTVHKCKAVFPAGIWAWGNITTNLVSSYSLPLAAWEPENQCWAAALSSSTDICRSWGSLEEALPWYSVLLTMGEKVVITCCPSFPSEFSSYLQLKRTHKMACLFTPLISGSYFMVRCSRLTQSWQLHLCAAL